MENRLNNFNHAAICMKNNNKIIYYLTDKLPLSDLPEDTQEGPDACQEWSPDLLSPSLVH